MTNAIINIIRDPKPGHYAEVLDAVKELFPTLDRPGNVTSTLAHPKPSNREVTVSLTGLTLDGVEQIMESTESSPEFRKKFDAIAVNCNSVKVQILRVVAPPEGFTEGSKFMTRNVLMAKRGQAGKVMDVMLRWREAMEIKPLLTTPLGGSLDVVRATVAFPSLEAVAEAGQNIATNPEFQDFRDELAELTNSAFRSISTIVARRTP